jgi:hypothetical protein
MQITLHEVDTEPTSYPRHEAVAVSVLPDCDICRHVEGRIKPERALFDGRTHIGQWANMCHPHMTSHGVGLGLGRGQRLVIPGIGAAMDRHPAGRALRSEAL